MGVTHLVMTLANYSVSHRRRKTAIVEFSGNHDLEKMTGTSEPFEWNRIICYPNLASSRIADVINGDFEVIIFDMGSSYYRIRNELLRCDRKMILGSLVPWRKPDYVRFVMEEMGEDRFARNVTYLTINGSKKDKKDFYKITGQMVTPAPYFPELLPAGRGRYDFFEQLIM